MDGESFPGEQAPHFTDTTEYPEFEQGPNRYPSEKLPSTAEQADERPIAPTDDEIDDLI